jgi:hypothetical protein
MLMTPNGPMPANDEAAWELLALVAEGLGYYEASTYLMTCRMNPDEVAARITTRAALARARVVLRGDGA